jgi:hypothetical protein
LPIVARQHILFLGLILKGESHVRANGDGSSPIDNGSTDASLRLPDRLRLATGCSCSPGARSASFSSLDGRGLLRSRRRIALLRKCGSGRQDQ